MTKKIKTLASGVIATVIPLLLMLTPCANAAAMIDVSSWQTGINVTNTGTEIVVAKATEGLTYVNPDCDRVVQDALTAGQGVGVYHFAHTENDAKQEAQHFINSTRGYINKGIVPILDWEPNAPWDTNWALTWLHTVEAAWGTKPIIYTYQYVENSYDWTNVVHENYGLWIAAYTLGDTPIYGFNPPAAQPTLYHWPFAVAWQYTANGHVNGWNGGIDLSVVYGDLNTWHAYAGNGQVAPKPTPQPAPQPSTPNTPCDTDCVIIQPGQYVSMLWPDWWNVSVPSGNPSVVYPGDKVCHNGGDNTGTVSRTYVVQAGDTLSSIAAYLGISIYGITGYSSGNMNLIYPGEVLYY